MKRKKVLWECLVIEMIDTTKKTAKEKAEISEEIWEDYD